MAKIIKLTEEDINKVIRQKVQEALEHNVDLEYSPAIGNKKRGPGKDTMDQMKKRRNTKLDEDIDEMDIYRRLPDGDYDYDGDDGSDTEDGTTTITLDADDYRLALEDIYGRDFENVDELWEEYNWPEDISIKYTIHTTCDRGDYDTPSYCDEELADWEIDEDARYLSSLSPETFKLMEKAVEHHMERMDARDLNESKKNAQTVRMTESQFRRMIVECIKKALHEKCGSDEEAVSKSQQRLFGMVDAYKKGEMKNAPKKVKDIANGMSMKDVKDFAETKHKGLPNRVKKNK